MQGNYKTLAQMLAAIASVAALCGFASSANAAAPRFNVYVAEPDSAEAGESVVVGIGIQNVGNATSKGPITITDTVSPGLVAPEAYFFGEHFKTSVSHPQSPEEEEHPASCETTGLTFACTVADALPPGAQLGVTFSTSVESGASGMLENTVSVSGGGAAPFTKAHQIEVGPRQAMSIDKLGVGLLGSEGEPVTQAASVPADFSTVLDFKTAGGAFFGLLPLDDAAQPLKDVKVHLPAGLIGNPTAFPTCTADLLAQSDEIGDRYIPDCPVDSQVGYAHLMLSGIWMPTVPVYNMVAPPGAATELGFEFARTLVILDAYVRPGDHGIDVVSRNTSSTLPVTNTDVTIWGSPTSHSHDRMRGECLSATISLGANGRVCPTAFPEKAFLRLPTSCSGEGIPFGAETNNYTHPEEFAHASFTGPVLTGCEDVPFSPTIFTQPTATSANSPTGVAVQLGLPQNSNPEGLATSDLKKAVVTLPEGMALNPSSADGLQACDDAHLKLDSGEPSACPDAAKVGTVSLKTPPLENPIEGFIWLRTQNSSDPTSGEMFRLAIELRDDRHGIDIKLPGQVAANPLTGRLTSTFDDAPQLPFSDMTLHFKSGARAPLTTPFSCQEQTTEADLYPWARPDVPVHRKMTFQLTSGPEGTPCTATPGFNPGFNAGVASVQAGGFTPFLATFSRKDADQSMQRVSVKMPKGLLGSLIGLPLCPEAQANAGTCSPASEIGSVTAGAGDGPTPFYVTGGHVYMTQSYEGAPFGLSVVVPAKAGPFDLGQVVVRAKVQVDIHTAQLTVTTDPLPQIVGGVPVNLRLVNVTINRPNFTYNPTNCNPSEVSGTMTGGQGATAALSNRFQVTNCGALGFNPHFQVSTSGRTSRKSGASLTAKLTYPLTAQGKWANIAKVKVSLPKQLPSRLTTLQKACDAAVFAANPAACPAASRIGVATASTPVLPVPLNGPVYFVSHGGEAFPDLVVVLQGYGVTINLVGTTFISKAGITSTTFKEVPDVPVGGFELKLPQGPNSALAANGNLCTSKLVMPTIFVAQDGEEIKTNTKIAATGCTKHKTHKKHHKHKGKKK